MNRKPQKNGIKVSTKSVIKMHPYKRNIYFRIYIYV